MGSYKTSGMASFVRGLAKTGGEGVNGGSHGVHGQPFLVVRFGILQDGLLVRREGGIDFTTSALVEPQ